MTRKFIASALCHGVTEEKGGEVWVEENTKVYVSEDCGYLQATQERSRAKVFPSFEEAMRAAKQCNGHPWWFKFKTVMVESVTGVYDFMSRDELVFEIERLKKQASHVLYRTGEIGVPPEITDRNGDVVLSLCKVCRRGEVELEEHYCHSATARG